MKVKSNFIKDKEYLFVQEKNKEDDELLNDFFNLILNFNFKFKFLNK